MNYFKYPFALATLLCSFQVFAQSQYAIYVDAGSSGSRLHIFQYDNVNNTNIPEIKDVFSANVKPGISSYADHPEQAGSALRGLFDGANQFLQKNNIDPHSVKLNILATAGMRLLPEDQQQKIYINIHNYLNDHYVFQTDKIKTVTGQMESLYGWLDVNYLLETFQHHQATVGSIDMGGASTQIAFETAKKQSFDQIQLVINNQSHYVFTQSFLGLGQDQARASMLTNNDAAYCFPSQYKYIPSNSGNFNMQACANNYQTIIQAKLGNITIPFDTNTSFIAYSGIYFTYNFFGIDQTPSQQLFEQRIQAVCTQTWDEMKNAYPSIPEKYLSTYCADGVYHDQLLNYNYHINNSKLKVTNSLNGKDIDWTLGAFLYDLVTENKKASSK